MAGEWRDIQDDREKYAAYLCSREWSILKDLVHRRGEGLCERCFTRRIDAVHHLTYARKYAERLEDLQGLCNGCHAFTHAKSSVDPREIEEREVKLVRTVAREGDLYVDCGSHVVGLEGSIAISVWKGLCTPEQVRDVIERAIKLGSRMRKDHEEAADGE